MDYLLYDDLDILFFDKFYYYEYKNKFNKKLKVKNFYLVALDDEESNFKDINKNINIICGTTSLDILSNLETQIQKREVVFEDLDNRDFTILYLLSKGYTNKEVGEKLYLSEKTIKNNLTRIYKTLGVRGKYQAITLFL